MKKIFKAKICKIQKMSINSYVFELDSKMQIKVKPGQFISIYCSGLTFRRPFSVFFQNNTKIGILFKERGEGTKYIKSLKVGDTIDLAGVFGNGFDIKNEKSLLIGAGIGVAPIAFLKTELDKKEIENFFIAGFRDKFEIPNEIKIDKIYTDDGSLGERGSVLNYIGQVISEYKPKIIYVCGPNIVLKTVAQIGNKLGIETQVAMERVMACSIGVCRGCVIDIIKNGKTVNASVCKDGPVFKGTEIVWH